MLPASWTSPLLLWLIQAAVGGSFFIAVLARDSVDNRFFAAHSLLLSSLWLAISCTLGLTDNYLSIFAIASLAAAWRFRSGDVSGGKSCLLFCAAIGLIALHPFVDVPEDYSIWIKLWILLSVYIGVFMFGVLHLSLALVFAPPGWIDDPHYAAHKAAILVEKMIYFRVLCQTGTLVAIPMISDHDGAHLLASILHRPALLAATGVCGLLIPLMLLFPNDPEEQQSPHPWRFLLLAISCAISLFTGARLFL